MDHKDITTGKSAVLTGEYSSSHADYAVVNIVRILRQADFLVTQPLCATGGLSHLLSIRRMLALELVLEAPANR